MNYDPRVAARDAAGTHEFDREAPPVDNGTGIPCPQRFSDPAWAAAEWEKIFKKTWLLAGPTSDLREAGDFLVYGIAHESFIVVRGKDGRLHAHYNVCPHRGSRIVVSDVGSLDRFTCPFHGWAFEHDGRNSLLPDRETFRPEVLRHDCNLASVRCEEAAGLAFICLNPAAPSLQDTLGPMLGFLDTYELGKMNVVQHRRADWSANWKVGIDAFYEFYHQEAVHPQSLTMMDDRTPIDLYAGGMSRQFVPFGKPGSRYADQSGINPALAALLRDAGIEPPYFPNDAQSARAAIAGGKRQRAARMGIDYDHFSDAQLTDAVLLGLFPNVQIVCHPEAAFIHRFMPNLSDPNQTLYDTMILYRHVDAPGYKAPAWMGLREDADLTGATRPEVVHTGLGERPGMGELLEQDWEQTARVQQGTRSEAFRGALLSEQEARLRHFHREIDRRLGVADNAG